MSILSSLAGIRILHMNYMALLYLSEDSPESLPGSIMGDFDGPQDSAARAPGSHGSGYDT